MLHCNSEYRKGRMMGRKKNTLYYQRIWNYVCFYMFCHDMYRLVKISKFSAARPWKEYLGKKDSSKVQLAPIVSFQRLRKTAPAQMPGWCCVGCDGRLWNGISGEQRRSYSHRRVEKYCRLPCDVQQHILLEVLLLRRGYKIKPVTTVADRECSSLKL